MKIIIGTDNAFDVNRLVGAVKRSFGIGINKVILNRAPVIGPNTKLALIDAGAPAQRGQRQVTRVDRLDILNIRGVRQVNEPVFISLALAHHAPGIIVKNQRHVHHRLTAL